MKKSIIAFTCSLFFLSGLAQAGITINGQELSPGGYITDESGKLIKVNEVDKNGNGVGVNINNGGNTQQKDVEAQVNARLCANAFMRKILPQCR